MHVGSARLSGHSEFDPGHMLVSLVPYMIDQARFAARNDAHSYRDFRVGAAGFVFSPDSQETAILTAGNLKAKRHTSKVCAERKVLEQARKSGYQKAAGLVVAATTDTELIKEVTGVATPTLHPCGECQDFFEDHLLMADDTVIISTGLELDRYQVQTFGELKELYRADDPAKLESQPCEFGYDNWEQRIAMYDYLSIAERSLPEPERRPMGKLVQMALLASGL